VLPRIGGGGRVQTGRKGKDDGPGMGRKNQSKGGLGCQKVQKKKTK